MFGDRLKELRKGNGYSMDKLVALYNEKFNGKMNKSTISRYEHGLQNPGFIVVRNFAGLFNVTTDYLTETERYPENLMTMDEELQLVKIPVIGPVSAGLGCIADEDILDYEYVDKNQVQDGEDYRFLKVRGDSMYPKIEEGDLVLMRCQTSVDSGALAVVTVDGEEGLVKRVVYGRDWIELQSINPMYPPMRFEGNNVLRVRVCGLVKKIVRSL